MGIRYTRDLARLQARDQSLNVMICQIAKINSTCVWVDNTAAIAVATGNDFMHETVKHVTVKVLFLQDSVHIWELRPSE
jgi:hypothetical protein